MSDWKARELEDLRSDIEHLLKHDHRPSPDHLAKYIKLETGPIPEVIRAHIADVIAGPKRKKGRPRQNSEADMMRLERMAGWYDVIKAEMEERGVKAPGEAALVHLEDRETDRRKSRKTVERLIAKSRKFQAQQPPRK